MYQQLLVTRPVEKVCQITLNRTRQLNALAKITIQELHDAIAEFEKSEDFILLLTGSGRAFCFGADFNEFQNRAELPDLLQAFQDLIVKIYHCPKITVASINGFATGAGLDLALACDFRIAADKAKLGEAYISMGLVCDGGGSYFLTHLLGISRALEMLLCGDAISASDAKVLGIVHQVWSSEELQGKSIELAKALSVKPQTALRLLKRLVKQNAHVDLKTALENERTAQLVCFVDTTHQSIVQDFLSRKKRENS